MKDQFQTTVLLGLNIYENLIRIKELRMAIRFQSELGTLHYSGALHRQYSNA